MKFLIQNYKFFNNFSYFINFNTNKIFISSKYCYFILKIPSLFFYKIEKKKKKFIFVNFFFFLSFINILSTYHNKLFTFYFFILKLKGLGFRIRQLSKLLLKIFFNRSNYYYLHISNSIIFKYRTRRLFFFGISYVHLYLTLLNLIYLKEHLIYTISGILYPSKIGLLKPGKNKFR